LGGDFSPISLGEMIGHLHATFFDPLSLSTPSLSGLLLFFSVVSTSPASYFHIVDLKN
jgi:hypothetical protein